MRTTDHDHDQDAHDAGDGDGGAASDPPPVRGDIWVPARQAAVALARSERWLREECKAGHLPCRGEPRTGQVFLVPMIATEELADHDRR